MANLDLRPLSLGEILDRSFALYRQNFLLFLGIAAIPQIFVLALNLAQTFLGVTGRVSIPLGRPGASGAVRFPQVTGTTIAASAIIGIAALIVTVVAYLWTQGATVSAVSDLYLGRPTSIGAALAKIRGELGTLFGVGILSGLVTGLGFILLIIPGIYAMCRLMVAIPAAILENLGARDSLERSFNLTKDRAGRAFMILVLYFVLVFAVVALFTFPASLAVLAARNNPGMFQLWTAVSQILSSVAQVLVAPVFLISASVFYFDLRVRKEAFDIQMMMNPQGSLSPASTGIPSQLA